MLKISHSTCQCVHRNHWLQAVTTYDLSFIDIEFGWPGRAGDARVLRNCQLWYNLDNYLADGQRNLENSYHVVGDSAFPCRKHLMSSYKSDTGQDLDPVRSNFNRCLASKRQVILLHTYYLY